MPNIPQEFPFRMVAGTSLEARLDARCWGLYVSNYTAQWVEIPDANEFVPPNTRQVISLPGSLVAKAKFASPPGVVQPLAIATQAAILTYTEREVQPSGGVVGATALASVTQIERFTKGTLPAAGNPGRLILLTDYDRGLWKDIGTAFVSVEGEVFNVKQFGALGDGTTDDQAAIANAITALLANATGGVLYFPPGTYLVSVSPVITDPSLGTKKIHVVGYGAQITTTGGIYGFTLSIVGNTVAGPTISGLTINHRNNATALGGILIEGTWHAHLRDCTVIVGGNSATYRAVHVRNSTAASNSTGSFWGRLENLQVRRLSGADAISALGVVFEGGANSWYVTGGSIDANTSILIQPQVAASNTDPNSILITGMEIGGAVNSVHIDMTNKLNGFVSPNIKIIGNRFESVGTVLRITGATNPNLTGLEPVLALNEYVSYTALLNIPAGIVVTNMDPGQAQTAQQGRLTTDFFNTAANIFVTNAVAGTYVDFGAPFSRAVTVNLGDKVRVMVQGVMRKSAGGTAAIVIDRGGTKLPGVGGSASVYLNQLATYHPYCLLVVDSPAAGTYTYKPQVWTDDNNTAEADNFTSMTVEVLR